MTNAKPLVSLLIPSLKQRAEMAGSLSDELRWQASQVGVKVQVLVLSDSGELSIGRKRQILLDSADGSYIAFIDDDDWISNNYVETLYRAASSGVDCAGLKGSIRINGKIGKPFIHSLDYNQYSEDESAYYRPPNHLNLIKKSIAINYSFVDSSFGEDTEWAMQICKDKVLKTEYRVSHTIYYYNYLTKK